MSPGPSGCPWWWALPAQLLGAIPNARMLEFYPRGHNPMYSMVYRHAPELNADGTVTVPEVPGLGCDPNEEALARYQVA